MSSGSSNIQTLASTRTVPASSPNITAPTATMTLTTTATESSQQPPVSQPREGGIIRPSISGRPAVLRLRGAHASTGRSVSWAEDVVDNEGLGRKKSKVCCIYHRPRLIDESSDESSSDDSSSDDDSDAEFNPSKKNKGPAHPRNHSHDHDHDGDEPCSHRARKRRRDDDSSPRQPSPNAYERVPRNRPRDPTSSSATHQGR